MKKITLLLSALLMISFSVLAQIKMYLHFNDGTRVEYIASRLDSITFDAQTTNPDDGPVLPPVKPDDGDNNEDINTPEVELPGEGKIRFVVDATEVGACYGLGIEGAFCNYDPLVLMKGDEVAPGWFIIDLPSITAEDFGNAKILLLAEDGTSDWNYQVSSNSYDITDSEDYITLVDDYGSQNAIRLIDNNIDNVIIKIKILEVDYTPCTQAIPAGYAQFVFTMEGECYPETVIFTGNFDELPWDESDREMTRQADGTYVWKGYYPENFQFKAFAFIDGELEPIWLDGANREVTAGSAYVINFSGCFLGYCPEDEIIYPDEDPIVPDANGHEYVDLGLPSGTLWATINIGADSPEEYGDYFAWGETEPKDFYDWSTYKWCNGSYDTMTKYCTDSFDGTVDNKTTLDLSDDAAYVNWGSSWRMPTEAEQDELRDTNYTTWTWTTQNGVKGYKVTSKTNGNSIFLPAAGCSYGSSLDSAGSYGGYWSSSLRTSYSYSAYGLDFNSGYVGWYNSRYYGLSVRAVLSNTSEDSDEQEDDIDIVLPSVELPGEGKITFCVNVSQNIDGTVIIPGTITDWAYPTSENKQLSLLEGEENWYIGTFDINIEENIIDSKKHRFKVARTYADGSWDWSKQACEGKILSGNVSSWNTFGIEHSDIYIFDDNQVVYIYVKSWSSDYKEVINE